MCYIVNSFVVGCQNTPAKGSRYCLLHNGHATTFQDDMVTSEESKKGNSDTDTDTLILKIINEKCTRLGQIYDIKNTNIINVYYFLKHRKVCN